MARVKAVLIGDGGTGMSAYSGPGPHQKPEDHRHIQSGAESTGTQ